MARLELRPLARGAPADTTGRESRSDQAAAGASISRAPIRSAARPPDPALQTARAILRLLFGPPRERWFTVRFWDASVDEAGAVREPACTLVLKRRGALRRLLAPPSELALGEGYLRDDFDILGDMEAAAALADQLSERLRSPRLLAQLARLVLSLPTGDVPGSRRASEPMVMHGSGARHSRGRDAASVRFHYDLSNSFYGLWLDERMVYSCAYFRNVGDSLDAAQKAKLEHICRKLRLRPGERLLDIGCGWGGLVHYAAERYGVEALGITLSEPQAAFARRRIAADGLANRCHVHVCDYRELPPGRPFDKIVSVGMVEHVGRAQLSTYFETAWRQLRPGGLFLNHGIALGPIDPLAGPWSWAARRLWRDGAFVQRYVFPDGELVKPATMVCHAEAAGFETRDVENLREHYALTLRQWVRRLESHHAEAVEAAGETTYRIWRVYMAVSAHAFASGRLSLIQTLLSKPGHGGVSSLPLTRADLYVD